MTKFRVQHRLGADFWHVYRKDGFFNVSQSIDCATTKEGAEKILAECVKNDPIKKRAYCGPWVSASSGQPE